MQAQEPPGASRARAILSEAFSRQGLNRPEHLKLWRTLKADPRTAEVVRNSRLRFPVLWGERR